MTFRSTAATVPLTPAGLSRRPLSRTRVRWLPRPRSETDSMPEPPLTTKPPNWELICTEPAAMELFCRMLATSRRPAALLSDAVITWTGAGVVKVDRRIREPVTTSSPTEGAAAAEGLDEGDDGSTPAWAQTEPGAPARTRPLRPPITVDASRIRLLMAALRRVRSAPCPRSPAQLPIGKLQIASMASPELSG